MDNPGVYRPRNVDWKRAAALLYGDWGTSKAYVIGLAFASAAFGSLPIILAVCALTGLVGFNYILVCRHFPDGGGVYSAARDQSRILAVLGSLLLLAGFVVTASLSCWDAMIYFGVPRDQIKAATIAALVLMGVMNVFGPKHGGTLAIWLALPMVAVVVLIVCLSVPHLTTIHLRPASPDFKQNWICFTEVILALSGVEAIANLTGVMRLDPGSSMEKPVIQRTAARSILPVAAEVVFGTALLGWAMLSLPNEMAPTLAQHRDDMLRFLSGHYGSLAFGEVFGLGLQVVTGAVIGLLLISATNTAIAAMIGLLYMLGRDREMPAAFTRLNRYGVPWLPLAVALALPVVLAMLSTDLESMADKYAIGVVGAITVNLGSCAFNKRLPLAVWERTLMTATFLVLFAIEITIAKEKDAALFFIVCVLGLGFALRAYAMKRAGLETVTVRKEIAAAVSPEAWAELKLNLNPGQKILVAARGLTPVLRFALEEARLRNGSLYVLYAKELAVNLPGRLAISERPRWQEDPQAAKIMYAVMEMGQKADVQVIPLYAVSENPSATILDLSATLGVDILVLGSAHRNRLVSLLKGNVVTEVARNLPENIQLVIYG